MVLSVHDARGRKPLAILANYALHYVGGLPEGQVSSDYFGEFSRLMPTRVRSDEDFIAKTTLAITDKSELARLPKKAESYARKTMSMLIVDQLLQMLVELNK